MFMAYFAAWWDHPKADHWRFQVKTQLHVFPMVYHRAVDHYPKLHGLLLVGGFNMFKNHLEK